MQPYDFLMIAILVGLTLHGYSKGMAWQVAYLGSLIASYFVALKFREPLAPMFGESAPFNKMVAMLVIYVATSFVIWMLFRVVRRAIDSVKMEGFDHQMGALIGFARGALWCVGITFFAVMLLPEGQKERIISTRSGRTIAKMLDQTQAVVPPEVHQVIGPVIQRIEQRLQPGASQPNPQPFQQAQQQPWSHAAAAPHQPLTNQPQPPAGGWSGQGQAAGWPNPNPSGATAWPQPSPRNAGTPATSAGWPNPNP